MADNNSFLPEDYLEKRMQRRTNAISLSLFAVVMLGVVAAFLVTDRQRAQVRAAQQQVNDRFEEAARRIDQLDKLQRQKNQMVRKAKVTAMLLERVPRSLMLAELVNNMPSTVGLLNFNLETHVITPVISAAQSALDRARADLAKQQAQQLEEEEPQPEQTEVDIELVGLAPTDVQVAQFMTALGKSPLFADVNLGFSEEVTIDTQTLRRFRVDIRLNQNLDMTKFQPKMVKREVLPANPLVALPPAGGDKPPANANPSQPPPGVSAVPASH